MMEKNILSIGIIPTKTKKRNQNIINKAKVLTSPSGLPFNGISQIADQLQFPNVA